MTWILLVDAFAAIGALTVLSAAVFVLLVLQPKPQDSPGWDKESLERFREDVRNHRPTDRRVN